MFIKRLTHSFLVFSMAFLLLGVDGTALTARAASVDSGFSIEQLYDEAVALYKKKEYKKARVRFLQVKIRDAQFKSAEQFLQRIDQHLDYERQQQMEKVEQAQRQREKELEAIRQRAREIKRKLYAQHEEDQRKKAEMERLARLHKRDRKEQIARQQQTAEDRVRLIERNLRIRQTKMVRRAETMYRRLVRSYKVNEYDQAGHILENLRVFITAEEFPEKYRNKIDRRLTVMDDRLRSALQEQESRRTAGRDDVPGPLETERKQGEQAALSDRIDDLSRFIIEGKKNISVPENNPASRPAQKDHAVQNALDALENQ